MAKRILIVEDEPKTAAFLMEALQKEGYEVEVCSNGEVGLEMLLRSDYEGVILDVMLPGRDGLSVVRRLRQRNHAVPVLMLSARGEITERIEGLEAGADDYLPKPFGVAEVLARLKALTRRSGESKAVLMELEDLQMDVPGHAVWRAGQRLSLAPQEFRLLECLMRHPQEICSRSLLLAEAWGYQFDPGTNIVDVYVRRLRGKIDFEMGKKLLHTVKGMGYVLGDPR